ncbi:hypothetical protein IT072_03015 [Leifsonia sp. ZF2019]|uniref:hypothetical protein n=1 Tax=Leifsonia sp. ZF2019 TaxID=2781978 RepID=UPI001CBC2207|nr:hypothetical protein [Leifsonia sp. ZF2019]UAJ80059.1 hypothetical protein IT072_03015 [Leifsonia sp. ZF2019]
MRTRRICPSVWALVALTVALITFTISSAIMAAPFPEEHELVFILALASVTVITATACALRSITTAD